MFELKTGNCKWELSELFLQHCGIMKLRQLLKRLEASPENLQTLGEIRQYYKQMHMDKMVKAIDDHVERRYK